MRIFLTSTGCFHGIGIKRLPYLAKLTAFNYLAMPTDIYHISGLVNIITNILAFVVGVFYCYRSYNPPYMKIFPGYLFVSAAIEFFVNSYVTRLLHYNPFGNHQGYARCIAYNIYTVFELLMFAWFVYQIIQSDVIKKLLLVLLMLFFVYFIIYSLRSDIGDSVNMIAVILESIIIIIPCLTWYRELFTRSESVNLFRTPAFWLVTGVFFYLATIIPFFATGIYLTSHGLNGLVMTLSSINNFSLVITYMLFIKGFTCRTRRS